MQQQNMLKLLFVINNNSGSNNEDWKTTIDNFFSATQHALFFFELKNDCKITAIQDYIKKIMPDRVVAVGGDGTVKLVAECITDNKIPMAIVPGGSANGMAKEFNIQDKDAALKNITDGVEKEIHLLKVNDELCIHLSDIGFNAYMIKKFETLDSRGMWGYMKACWSVFMHRKKMEVELKMPDSNQHKKAEMVVLANATRYGTGALINPKGSLEDDLFEIIVIKKFSVRELIKMMFTHAPYDPAKTEIHQVSDIHIQSKRPVHFQVDGEYLGKVNEIKATLLKKAIKVIVPKV